MNACCIFKWCTIVRRRIFETLDLIITYYFASHLGTAQYLETSLHYGVVSYLPCQHDGVSAINKVQLMGTMSRMYSSPV